MTIILVILIAIVVIVRISHIIESMLTYDFLVGLIPIAHVVGIVSGNWSIIPVWVALIWILNTNGYLPSKRLRVSNGWIIASYILCVIPSFILLILFGQKEDEFIITFYAGFISIALMLWKPIRAPFFVVLNILLLGLIVYKLDNAMGDTSDMCVDSSQGGEEIADCIDTSDVFVNSPEDSSVVLDTSAKDYMNNSSDTIISNTVSDSYDTLQQSVDIHGLLPNAQNFIIDPSPFIGYIVSPTDTIVVSDASGMPSMTLRDGVIFDGSSLQIGSYEYNKGMERTIFFDSNHNLVYSVNSSGIYFDSTGQQIGCARNAGAVITIFDVNEQPIYQIDNTTNSIFDKFGRPIGIVEKS